MKESVTEYERLMSLYLENKCTTEQIERLAAWVDEHPDNAKEYHLFRNVWEADHPAFAFGDIDVDGARKRVFKAVGIGGGRFGKFVFWWKSIAAVLLLPLLAAGAALVYVVSQRGAPDPVWQSFTAPYGVYADIILPDSSKVCLNSGSTLSYPSRFSGGRRDVRLQGEAYFEVRSDKDHPFAVSVKDMEIVATGTEFNIEAYPEAERRVTLVTGRLDVKVSGRSYALPAGYQLLHGLGDTVSCFKTDTFKWTSWRNGVIAFRGDRLSYVFGRLSSLYDIDIEIVDAKVADYQIRATFRNERLDEIMSLIEQTAPIRCQRTEPSGDGVGRAKYLIYSK